MSSLWSYRFDFIIREINRNIWIVFVGVSNGENRNGCDKKKMKVLRGIQSDFNSIRNSITNTQFFDRQNWMKITKSISISHFNRFYISQIQESKKKVRQALEAKIWKSTYYVEQFLLKGMKCNKQIVFFFIIRPTTEILRDNLGLRGNFLKLTDQCV